MKERERLEREMTKYIERNTESKRTRERERVRVKVKESTRERTWTMRCWC